MKRISSLVFLLLFAIFPVMASSITEDGNFYYATATMAPTKALSAESRAKAKAASDLVAYLSDAYDRAVSAFVASKNPEDQDLYELAYQAMLDTTKWGSMPVTQSETDKKTGETTVTIHYGKENLHQYISQTTGFLDKAVAARKKYLEERDAAMQAAMDAYPDAEPAMRTFLAKVQGDQYAFLHGQIAVGPEEEELDLVSTIGPDLARNLSFLIQYAEESRKFKNAPLWLREETAKASALRFYLDKRDQPPHATH